jgi:hypothetical protein
MQKSVGVDIRIPSHLNGEQAQETIKRKLAIEPTEVLTRDGLFVTTNQEAPYLKPKPKQK